MGHVSEWSSTIEMRNTPFNYFSTVSVLTLLLGGVCGVAEGKDEKTILFKSKYYIIHSPIDLIYGRKRALTVDYYNDGGTQSFHFQDSEGVHFDVFVDHRLFSENYWGTLYLGAFPETKGSVRIQSSRTWKNGVLNFGGILLNAKVR